MVEGIYLLIIVLLIIVLILIDSLKTVLDNNGKSELHARHRYDVAEQITNQLDRENLPLELIGRLKKCL